MGNLVPPTGVWNSGPPGCHDNGYRLPNSADPLTILADDRCCFQRLAILIQRAHEILADVCIPAHCGCLMERKVKSEPDARLQAVPRRSNGLSLQ